MMDFSEAKRAAAGLSIVCAFCEILVPASVAKSEAVRGTGGDELSRPWHRRTHAARIRTHIEHIWSIDVNHMNFI